MHNMCHFCGAELTKSNECNKTQENESSLQLDGGDHIWSCKFCGGKQEQESIKENGLSTSTTPFISPTDSLKSSDSFVSSCSEFSVDVNLYGRGNQDESIPFSGQEDPNNRLDGQLHNLILATSENRLDRSNTMKENNFMKSTTGSKRYSERDIEIKGTSDGQEARETGVESTSRSFNEKAGMFDYEMDAKIWEPPEAEDSEDDMEGSVANDDDDDDECGDGTKWGKPSSLSNFKKEGRGSYKFKAEKQRAIEEVINGKFKVLVNQLLKSVGVTSSVEDGESWVDIVTSLSWEAASFVKPDAIEGKAMDPDGYVKVKCIATGSRNQSQVIKGLVFKKHAAHKHMPTKYKNPRLLLIRGMLGHSSSGLSSFNSMEQEKDYLKSVIDMIEKCHPNVVLVEKTVSRDIQESILAKGMTLVFDMKLHRLERVARCTGSPIISSDTLMNQKLRHCDYLHFERFVEEYAAVGEGGKKPSKTLMFLEGCPTRLGCTILLKGTHSDELKRIKCVVQCAVVMAYHLILETSFLVDQKAMISTIPFSGVANGLPTDQQAPFVSSGNSHISCHEESTAKASPSCTIIDVPISNGFHEGGSPNLNLGLECNSTLSYEPYNPAILSGISSLSASLKKVIGDRFPLVSSTDPSLPSYSSFNERETNSQITTAVPVLTSAEAFDNNCDMEAEGSSNEGKSLDCEQSHSLSVCYKAPLERKKIGGNNEDQMQSNDDISTVLDSQSILVLMSSRNASRGTICEQSHFSHIKFYKNFDVPLGKFLRDNILNQRCPCTTCGELPEAHFYYYAHHNKQLTIQVKRLPGENRLPGEAEGKLWMWSRCGKCKPGNGISKSTKRVLISSAARGLSFGKFLELSFSHHSSSSRLSSCGHSLERDFLHFFGLGPMVAMFSYAPVVTYTVSMPPQRLVFNNSIRQDWLRKETENVYMKGILVFTEVANSLQKLGSQFAGSNLSLHGSLKAFSDIEEMLRQERSEFEVNIQNAVVKNGNSNQEVYKFLRLNRLLWELLLESYIWDRRLHSLLSPDPTIVDTSTTGDKAMQGQLRDGPADRRIDRTDIIEDNCDKVLDDSAGMKIKLDKASEYPIKEIPVEGLVQGSRDQDDPFNASIVAEAIERPTVGSFNPDRSSDQDFSTGPHLSAHQPSGDENFQEENFTFSDHLQVDRTIPITTEYGDASSVNLNVSQGCTSLNSLIPNLETSKGWVWTPFSELRREYMKDLQEGYLPKFEAVSGYTPEFLPSVYQLLTEEGSRLHIPLGTDDYIVSDYEGEPSSIIACALSLLKDLPVPAEDLDEDIRREKGMAAKRTESSQSLTRISSMSSPHWSSTSSLDLDGMHSTTSIASEESRFSSFDGLNLLDSVVSFRALHPVVSLGVAKFPGKGKYSVVSLYASWFRDLRNRCCPSEHDYIASLSRCRNWDAKGGKSKAFFAKTLDDRFIIKEIKKTEFESFMKFAPDYFEYMNQCYELGNQTCLAKILGIYQIIIRQTKSGKEVKHDLMVMENLSFGRNITRQYDLKGALHARYNSAADGSGDVLLDQNFVNDMNNAPLYVSNNAKRILQRAVWNDTTFLNSINVMDYSLLVGVDTKRFELVCGIIDYLRQYTWDKQLETWVKSSLVVPKNLLPTVISPIDYKKRFRKFMSTHFLSVPDDWCSCELCGIRDHVPSQSKKSLEQREQNGSSA